MCREYGKIDQNFSCNLLTNMDQYAAIYVQIVPIDITPIYMLCSITYVYLSIYNYSI